MKITTRRNKAMALASLVIIAGLLVLFVAGVICLCIKIQKWAGRVAPPPPPDDPTLVEWSAPVNAVSSVDEGTPIETPFGAITLPPGSPVTNSVVHFWVQSSSNLVDWIPLTNFYCTVDEIERVFQIPVDPSLPGQFFRIGAGEPAP